MGLGSRAKRTVVAALAVGGIVAAPSVASAAPDVHRVAGSPQAVREYWTPERIADAIPLDNVPSMITPLSSPAKADSAARRKSSHTRVKHIDSYPNRTNGKVYFSIGPSDYQCSGTSVHSPGKSLVVTAGHCVYEQATLFGGYVDNWEFIPAFRGGSHEPYGEWPASSLRTTNQYEAGSPVGGDDGSAYDIGTAIVAPLGGHTLQATVGARKPAFNTNARKGHYRPFGYPASPPPREFTGNTLFSCHSSLRTRDGSFKGPPTLGINCDMTGGASGGGWINDSGKIVSVTSYGYTSQPGILYGPYFGTVAKNLLNSVGGR